MIYQNSMHLMIKKLIVANLTYFKKFPNQSLL